MSGPRSGAIVIRDRGVKLVGVLNAPASRGGRGAPAVLFLHGFPGAEKSVDVQRALLLRGAASLSLHFRGAWGSEGFYEFSDLVRQAEVGLRVLAAQDGVDDRRLGVFGFSMGGWAALNLAGRTGRLKAVAAVAPVGGPEMVTSRTQEQLRRISQPLRLRSRKTLARDFAAAVAAHDPHRAAARLKAPLLLLHGDRDEVVPIEVSRRLARSAAGPCRLVVASGARHDFLDRRPWLTRLVSRWLLERLR